MTPVRRVFIAAVLAVSGVPGALAASLSVSPIRVDVVEPANAGRVTLRNAAQGSVNVQIRIFKWSAKAGQDDFQETQQVVASPPFAQVPQNGEIEVRILRVGGSRIRGEEPYRLVIDEVPDANRVRNVGVNVAIRYALPVFYFDGDATPARIAWSVGKQGGHSVIVATNSGDKHARIADLAVDGAVLAKGLAGYVLGNSTRIFPLPAGKSSGGKITAATEQGRLDARLSP